MSPVVFQFGLAAVITLLAYLGVIGLLRWAEQRMLDIPNERSSHTHPTPRGGGLVIVVCTLLGLWLSDWFFAARIPVQAMAGYSLGAALIALVSWLDDLRSLSNRIRFSAHAAGALLILLAVGFWQEVDLPFVGFVHWGWLGVPFTFLWVVGLTNAYNFMDGIDGLAGSQAVIAGAGWAGLGWLGGEPLVSLLGLLVAGSSFGFLLHNWPPARIFMGDVGSAFLGFTFAALSVLAAQQNPRLAVAGILLLWPFLFDTAFTFLRRLRRRENVFAAHRSHLYQRLVIAGYSHRTVTLLYSGLALVGVVLAFGWVLELPGTDWLAVGIPSLLCLGLWRSVVHREYKLYRD
ncbi:MAG: glycosyltransferase family 4 protein [Caldilineaceae bacterium]|nr:glycosyltransferase family 4 protein [Caldilineaceae bacterium]